jgi:ABC-type sulfate transport system substrate-binding protein
VQAFVEFLLDVEGQAILGRYHLRPPLPECQARQEVELPFLVDDLGGWSSAYRRLVEDFWQAEILPGLQLEP